MIARVRTTTVVGFVTAAVLTITAAPQDTRAQAQERSVESLPLVMEVVGAIAGRTSAVAVRDQYAYLGVGTSIEVLDVSDPSAPTRVSTVRLQRGVTPGNVRRIVIDGQHAFVAAEAGGLWVLDLAVPRHPRQVAELAFPVWVNDLQVSDGYAFLGGYRRVYIVDISSPATPRLAMTLATLNQIGAVTVADGYLYVAIHPYPDRTLAGFRVYDVRDPRALRLVAYVPVAESRLADIAIDDGVAYMIDRSSVSRLFVFDVSNARHPVELARIVTAAEERHLNHAFADIVRVAGGYAYVGQTFSKLVEERPDRRRYVNTGELVVIDVREPHTPRHVGRFELPPGLDALDISFSGGNVLVAVGDMWPDEGGNLDADPALHGGLRVVAATDPSALVEIGRYVPVAGALDVIGAGRIAFVREAHRNTGEECANRIHLMDVSQPHAPRRLSAICTSNVRDMSVLVGDDHLAVLEYGNDNTNATIALVDFGDPRMPSAAGRLALGDAPVGMTVGGHHAFALTHRGATVTLHVVDLSDPARPRRVVELSYEESYYGLGTTPVLLNDHLYLAFRDLHVLDVAVPSSPREIEVEADECWWRLGIGAQTANGPMVYAAGGGYDHDVILTACDVSNPARPVSVAEIIVEEGSPIMSPGEPESVTYHAGRVYLSMGKSGLRVIDVTQPKRMRQVAVFDAPHRVHRTTVLGCHALIAGGHGGLMVASARSSAERVPRPTTSPDPRPRWTSTLYMPFTDRGDSCLLGRR